MRMTMGELLAEHTDQEIEQLKRDIENFDQAAEAADRLAEEWREAAAGKRRHLAEAAAELAREVGAELVEE